MTDGDPRKCKPENLLASPDGKLKSLKKICEIRDTTNTQIKKEKNKTFMFFCPPPASGSMLQKCTTLKFPEVKTAQNMYYFSL